MALGTQLHELVDAFSELVAQHVRLARMELKEDARFIGLRVGVIAAFAPVLIVGYCFVCIALALTLGRQVMSVELAFLLVGVLNLVIAGTGIAIAGQQLSTRKVLNATIDELESSSAVVLPRAKDAR